MTRALALGFSLWLCACVSLDKAPGEIPAPVEDAGDMLPPSQDGSPQAGSAGDGDGGGSSPVDGGGSAGPVDGETADGSDGADAGHDSGSAVEPVMCGNGALDDGERCDTALVGPAGACPSACPSSNACTPRTLTGSGCLAYCAQAAISSPIDGDGCCPSGADLANDRDCCAAPERRTITAGENERADSASELGDVTLHPVVVDGGSVSADYTGESLGCASVDRRADAVYAFDPSQGYPLVLALDGGGDGATLALFDTPPPRAIFVHAPRLPSCQGMRLNGRVYFACDAATSWSQAHQRCAAEGLSLARIDGAAENAALTGALGVAGRWIGLNDRSEEGSFTWVDGSAAGYSAWAAGNPDGGASADCAELRSDGSWNDRACSDALPYLCELPGTLTGDLLDRTDPFTLDDKLYVFDGDARVFGNDRDPGLDVCGADVAFPDGFIPFDLAHAATVEIDSSGSDFAPVLALYARNGVTLSGAGPLECHDSAVDGPTQSVFLAAGSYAFVVSGHATPGEFHIVVRDVAASAPGNRVACAASGTPLELTPVAGTLYFAIVKADDAYSLSITPEACQ